MSLLENTTNDDNSTSSRPSTHPLAGTEIPCLDKGFVRLVDAMGDDSSIVQAARVSYGKGTKKVTEDRGLIRYLMRHSHTTPFEMVEFKFHIKLPIFIARQWIRHRTANVNEYSGRYSVMKDEFYLPDLSQLRAQSTTNRQGRSEEIVENSEQVKEFFAGSQREAYREYEELLSLGLARELARISLPVSMYTEWYWKIDLHNLFHFLRLRLDSHAQYEIRVYAEALASIVKQITPVAFEAFEDYVLYAEKFTRVELLALKAMLSQASLSEIEETELAKLGLSKREQSEFQSKIEKFLR